MKLKVRPKKRKEAYAKPEPLHDDGRRLDTAEETYEGLFRKAGRHFGVVTVKSEVAGEQRIYVERIDAAGAMHGDVVRVRLLPGRPMAAGYRYHGAVIEFVSRANAYVIGTYDLQKTFAVVMPDDERMGDGIFIPTTADTHIRSGAKVRVRITEWPTPTRMPEGEVETVIGYEGDKGLDISLIMAKYGIPVSFPKDVVEAAEASAKKVRKSAELLDLRGEDILTIDGEDAKDLDDAVSVTKLPNGRYRLGVHIADVSRYVAANGVVDKEAYDRGTSVYLADRVVPMLPEVLSNGVCSLNAGEDRYAMSCIMDIDEAGKVRDVTIAPSIIRVSRRCSYPEIFKALEQDIVPEDLVPFMNTVRELREVADILTAMRRRRGAISFDFPEYKVVLDNDGLPLRIVKRPRTIAERLIEECMLVANETVAAFLMQTNRPSVYRVHDVPNPEKTETLKSVMRHSGHGDLRWGERVSPGEVQAFLDGVAGTDIEPVAQMMTLRAMQQAKYAIENIGHFGLASRCYTHFTSPIRRYPDLLVHRLLKRAIARDKGQSVRDLREEYLSKAAAHASVREQRATAAERETTELKKVQYMEAFIGQAFEGKINGITDFGLFVEIDNGIDGLVHVSLMRDDHYVFDEAHFVMVGRRRGMTYRLGQTVTVTLIKADAKRRQIDFVLGDVADMKAFVGTVYEGRKIEAPGIGRKGAGNLERMMRLARNVERAKRPKTTRGRKHGKKKRR